MPAAVPSRRGAALLLVLLTVLLVGSYIAIAASRRHVLAAGARRAEARDRLRAALWDAAWTALRQAGPGAPPAGGRYEAPDGVATEVTVQPGPKKGLAAGPFTIRVTAVLDRHRREAWARVRPVAEGFRIQAWVER